MSATLATLLPGLASAIGSNGPVFDAWLQWWLMACLGTLLVVPLLAGGSWQVLMQLVARRTELGLVLLATVLVTLASLGAPTPRNGFIVGPLALILVGYATLRLHFSVALAVAGVLTCVIGISAQAAPVSEFVSELFGLARASAFGLVNVLLIFTVQVLRSERTAALDALRAAERQHHEALVRAVRLEQVRIGERMHDEVGQEATALSLLARSIERRLHQGAPIQPTDAQAIVESAQRIHTATRDAVQRLLAVEIYNGSLRVALESLVERLRRAGAPDIELRLPAIVPDLHPQISEILYRTAQEALTNAVKHAQASRIAVELTLAGDQLGLRVTDNGVGFCVEAINGGFGLRTMRNRAEQAGGRFHSASRANVGTEILVELPLAPTLAR
jgi:signal transduction histidine kinase